MGFVKKEVKKLGSMSLIIVGGFLLLEHIYTYGYISLLDVLGHEWIGLILVISGFILAGEWSKERLIAGWEWTKDKFYRR